MTRFLLIATLILLVVGIPVSTIYWWPQFWGPQFSHLGYWDQWVHWLKIASAVLAALWLLRLIIWIIAKKRENKFYREAGRAMKVPPIGQSYYFGPDGPGGNTPPPNASETIETSEFVEPKVSEPNEFIDPREVIRPRSVFEEGQDFLSRYKYHENEHAKGDTDSTKEGKIKNYENDARILLMKGDVSRLVEEGKLAPNEAIKLRQDIEKSIDSPETYLDTKRFLQAIRRRPSK